MAGQKADRRFELADCVIVDGSAGGGDLVGLLLDLAVVASGLMVEDPDQPLAFAAQPGATFVLGLVRQVGQYGSLVDAEAVCAPSTARISGVSFTARGRWRMPGAASASPGPGVRSPELRAVFRRRRQRLQFRELVEDELRRVAPPIEAALAAAEEDIVATAMLLSELSGAAARCPLCKRQTEMRRVKDGQNWWTLWVCSGCGRKYRAAEFSVTAPTEQ